MEYRSKISVAEPDIGQLELKYVSEAVKKGELSAMGEFVGKFEDAFAEFCEVPYASACMNGTVALHLALLGAGICPGDEVIVPALTYVSTANAVVHAGGIPIFVDIHPEHWGIDPSEVTKKITPKTKAIIAVHLYGHPADMDPLLSICAERGITLIEDAAEAHGARYKGRRVGGIAPISTFSFFGNKILTCGEGGMVTCHNKDIKEKINVFKNHGNDPEKRYQHQVIGYNYRMTNVQAAIGLAQVENSESLLIKKAKIAKKYETGLRGLPCSMQPKAKWATPVNWMNCLVLEDGALSVAQLQKELYKLGIETRPFFVPIPKLPIYDDVGRYPVAEQLAENGINLPSGTKLTDEQIDFVIAAIQRIFENS